METLDSEDPDQTAELEILNNSSNSRQCKDEYRPTSIIDKSSNPVFYTASSSVDQNLNYNARPINDQEQSRSLSNLFIQGEATEERRHIANRYDDQPSMLSNVRKVSTSIIDPSYGSHGSSRDAHNASVQSEKINEQRGVYVSIESSNPQTPSGQRGKTASDECSNPQTPSGQRGKTASDECSNPNETSGQCGVDFTKENYNQNETSGQRGDESSSESSNHPPDTNLLSGMFRERTGTTLAISVSLPNINDSRKVNMIIVFRYVCLCLVYITLVAKEAVELIYTTLESWNQSALIFQTVPYHVDKPFNQAS